MAQTHGSRPAQKINKIQRKKKKKEKSPPSSQHNLPPFSEVFCPWKCSSKMCQQAMTKAKQEWIFKVNLMCRERRRPPNLPKKGDLHTRYQQPHQWMAQCCSAGGKERQLQEPVWPPRPVWEQGQSFPGQMLFWRVVLNKLNSFHSSPESARHSSDPAMGTGPDCAVTKENFSFKSSLLRTGDFLRL